MYFNIFKVVAVLLFVFIASCNEPDSNPPTVKFDVSDMPRDYKFDSTIKVFDNDQLFSEKEKNDLQLILEKLQKEKNFTLHILTDPSKLQVNNEWAITKSLNFNGVSIIIARHAKTIDVGIESNNDETLFEKSKEDILLHFQKEDYYKGVMQIITDLIK